MVIDMVIVIVTVMATVIMAIITAIMEIVKIIKFEIAEIIRFLGFSKLHPKIIGIIQRRATLGFYPTPTHICDACAFPGVYPLERRIYLVEKHGCVCKKCQRKAGVVW